jgi:hypothetical protein
MIPEIISCGPTTSDELHSQSEAAWMIKNE